MSKEVTTFKVGDRVSEATSQSYDDYESIRVPLRWDPDSDPNVGVVQAILPDGRVFVKWDSEWANRNSRPVEASELMLEADAVALLAQLEVEFNVAEAEIKIKIKEVAKGIREANALAEKTGRTLSDMHGLVRGELYGAMDDAGWRTSSFGC